MHHANEQVNRFALPLGRLICCAMEEMIDADGGSDVDCDLEAESAGGVEVSVE